MVYITMHRILPIVIGILAIGTLSSSTIILFDNNSSNIVVAYAQQDNNIINNTSGQQRVSFLTDDKVLIVGTYYTPQTSSSSNNSATTTSTNAIILLHMLGYNRNDWNSFASTLSNESNGYAVLSIDLRGHGDSTTQNGNTISFQSFTASDFNEMVADVKAAKQFLVTQKNINPNNIAIVGASIGANIALNYAASDPSIKAVVLLSPGLNY